MARELAESAWRNSTSIKTVVVLTIAFLPATFFAALFSMPSLGWDAPEKFIIYWA